MCQSKCNSCTSKRRTEDRTGTIPTGIGWILVLIVTVCGFLLIPKAKANSYTDNITYSVGVSQSKIAYDWYGASEATFNFDLTVVRFSVGYDLNKTHSFEARYGHGLDMKPTTSTDLMGTDYTIDFSKYQEFEAMYRYKVTGNWSTYIGVGLYLQEVPISWKGGYKYDEDNDTGSFIGTEYYLTKHFTIDLFIKQTSKIGKGSGHSTEVALGSTIRQVGLGINYKF